MPSWSAVCGLTKPWLMDVVDCVVVLACFGTAASFFVGVGDFGPTFLRGIGVISNEPGSKWGILNERWVWATATAVFIAPFAWMRNLRSLKFTSAVGHVSTVYLFIFVLVYYLVRVPPDETRIPWKDLRWWPPQLSLSLLSALPILTFCYACHQNIFAILNELRNHTPARMDKVINRSLFTATLFYLATATLAYATFGDATRGDVLLNYAPQDPLTLSACLTLAILVLTSIPLQIHPARSSAMHLIQRGVVRVRSWFVGREGGREEEERLIRRDPYEEERELGEAVSEPLLFNITTFLLLASCWAVAIWVTHLDRILSFVGATGNAAMGLVLPHVFFVSLSLRWTRLAKVSVGLGLLGVGVSVVALVALALEGGGVGGGMFLFGWRV